PAVDRDGWLAEGTESYRTFIRSLLSVTDNILNDKVVHPADVVIRDGEDPYFVVAADKGTATFSDVANAIALDRNFSLGDAFASGGSPRAAPHATGRPGPRHLPRCRERNRARSQFLAWRRVRQRRLAWLRPQGDGHHCARRLGLR